MAAAFFHCMLADRIQHALSPETLLLLALIAPIAIAWFYQTYIDFDDAVLPDRVLGKLEVRFDQLQPAMDESEVLQTLRLHRYKKYLASNHSFMMTGGGHNLKVYVLSPEGHRLEFRDFMGNSPCCILHLPGRPEAKSAPIGQLVSQMSGFMNF